MSKRDISEIDDDEDEETYKQQANHFKEQGNEAFQKGDVDLAIQFFTQAINIDPDNYLVYSNRSAAYMKQNHISKAFHDAEKCVELAPTWAKGYNRLGTAQQGLKRFDAAIQSFKKGIELEPNNPALWSALKLCERAYEQDKKERFARAEQERKLEEERLKRKEDKKNEILEEQSKKPEEDLLDDFFQDIGNSSTVSDKKIDDEPTEEARPAPKEYHITKELEQEDELLATFFNEVTSSKEKDTTNNLSSHHHHSHFTDDGENEKEDDEEKNVLTEKYAKQNLGSGKEIFERLTGNFYQWKNLNPYAVFDMDIDATEEDIKFRYKKLSLKVHPDRLRNIENAREAFEQVKAAYEKLMDEDQRKTIIAHIENVTDDLRKERKRLLAAQPHLKETDLKDFQEERKQRLMKHFADLEQMKRLSDKNRRVYSAREKQQEDEVLEKAQKFEEFEKEWGEENRREKRMGNWQNFQHDPVSKKFRANNFKEESRNNGKVKVQVEEWRKNWK